MCLPKTFLGVSQTVTGLAELEAVSRYPPETVQRRVTQRTVGTFPTGIWETKVFSISASRGRGRVLDNMRVLGVGGWPVSFQWDLLGS